MSLGWEGPTAQEIDRELAEMCRRFDDAEPLPPHVGRYDRFVYIGLELLALAAIGAAIFVKFTWNLP